VFFSASALCGHSPRGASENGRVRLGTSAACGPNRKGRSRNRGPPFLLQGCVFDRAERTAEKDGALFSRRATKSGCLRLLQVDPPLWDYNTIGWAGRVSNAPLPLLQLLRPRSGSRKQFVAKTFRPGGTLEDSKGGSGGTLEGYYYVTTCREQPNNAMIIVMIMGIIICMIIRNIIIIIMIIS
jgi:hypothetical protein